MPPPLRCASLIPPPSVCRKQCYRPSQTRSFSSTPQNYQRVTRNRRQLFQWLSLTGVNFYNPASGSTNYLSAYTADGALRRSANQSEDMKDGKNEEKGEPGQKKIPPETGRDLRPFPLNRDFRSERVLSEELREKIWESVMIEGKSVRDVSAQFSVEMSRVGAVVRLMEIEKEWKRIVSQLASISLPQLHDDYKQNRLVFKTTTWLQNLACEPL
jgi:hypothetical protein